MVADWEVTVIWLTPTSGLTVVSGDPDPKHANGDAPLYAVNKWIQQEACESRTPDCGVLLSLQFLPRPQDAESDASDGSRAD